MAKNIRNLACAAQALLLTALACEHAQSTKAPVAAPVTPSQEQHALTSRVLRIGFTVSNLEQTTRALELLDFKRVARHEPASESLSVLYGLPDAHARLTELTLGNETLELTECTTRSGRAIPSDSASNDAWFQHIAIVVGDMDAAYARVFGAPGTAESPFKRLSPGPQTIPLSNAAAGGIRALYFRDPDDHNLELIWFPAGKGQPRWHASGPDLFLGIDHTAIAVAEGERGRKTYASIGFGVVGTSLNFGAEQEALSGVAGARVAITGLRDAGGPGVEFLSYLAPAGGRQTPADSTPCDLWHWEITIAVPNLDNAVAALEGRGIKRSSSAIATFPDGALGYRRAVLVRDPDGHALRLVEQ